MLLPIIGFSLASLASLTLLKLGSLIVWVAVLALALKLADQTVFVASCKHRKPRTSISHKGGGRNPKAFAESADLANIELPLACKDFRNYALTANLVQIALLDAVLFYQEL